jgi:uncharacterized membrane protein YbhN (UPF0104 family)
MMVNPVPARDVPADEREVDDVKAASSLRRGLISLAIFAVVVVGLLVAVPGLHGVGSGVAHMRAGWLVVAIGCELVSCLGYVLAFLQVFVRAPVRFGAQVALSELAFGAAVPLGGVGSAAVGSWLLVERGGPVHRVEERSAVLFLLTSAINLITLVLAGGALALGVVSGPSDLVLSVVPAAVGTGVFVAFLLLPRVTDRLADARHPGKFRMFLSTTSISIRATERILFSADWWIVGAYAFLWADIAVLVVCFEALGVHPPLAAIVLAYQIGYLSNVIPIPGGIGVLDGSMVGMLVLYGVGARSAAAASIVYHAISLGVPVVWGTLAYVMVRRSRGRPLRPRPLSPRRARQPELD